MEQCMGGDEVLKREVLNQSETFARGKNLPFALIRTWSSVALGPTPEMIPESVTEARFFGAEEEIRVFCRDGVLEGVHLQTEEGDASYLKTYSIANPVFGKSLTVRYELEYDEDGQCFVAATRLADWKGA